MALVVDMVVVALVHQNQMAIDPIVLKSRIEMQRIVVLQMQRTIRQHLNNAYTSFRKTGSPNKPVKRVIAQSPGKLLMFLPSIAIFIISIIGNVNGQQPMTVYGEPRESITLHCPLTLASELSTLYWKKDGRTILSLWSGHDPSPTEDKYGLAGNTSLMITDIDRSDAAIYTCTAYLMDGGFYESDTIQLFVLELSVSHCPDTKDSGNNVGECDCHINRNLVSDLTCTALGFPQEPSLSWELGDQLLLGSSVDLTRYSNNMTLVCRAEDPVFLGKRVCVYYQRQIHTDEPDQDIELYDPSPFVWLTVALSPAILVTTVMAIIIVLQLYAKGSLRRFLIGCRERSKTNTRGDYGSTNTDDIGTEKPRENGRLMNNEQIIA